MTGVGRYDCPGMRFGGQERSGYHGPADRDVSWVIGTGLGDTAPWLDLVVAAAILAPLVGDALQRGLTLHIRHLHSAISGENINRGQEDDKTRSASR